MKFYQSIPKWKKPIVAIFCLVITPLSIAATSTIEEVLVTADFRTVPEMNYAASLSVVDSHQIKARAAQNLDEILNLAPNVNFAAGASRGRYIQIRGIGERSQFVDPINPSVGLMIDGINLSGVASAAMLFDVNQVEVLRGPQGTRFGANALAGMVNITSMAPTDRFEGTGTVGIANNSTWQVGGVLSGPLSQNVKARLALQQHVSDGYIENTYLNRDDTNNRDETLARARISWQANQALSIDATLFYVDVDNGYDAFSLDNNRKTLSDQPGTDTQETLAFATKIHWVINPAFNLEGTITLEDTEVDYGYDEDWTNTAICENLACDSDLWGFDWWYSSTDRYLRDRKSNQLDIRLVSGEEGKILNTADWVIGLYFIDQQEALTREFFDWVVYNPATFKSDYDTQRMAVYGQISIPLTNRLKFTIGGRVEDFSADYHDSRLVSAKPDETLWGGDISLDYQLSDNSLVYGLVSRGFKAGGVNGEALGKAEQNNFDSSVIDFLSARLIFDTETATNMELGLKSSLFDDRWQVRLAAFYMKRHDVQLKGWYNDGPLFVGYTDNGASGTNYGLELETSFSLTDNLTLFASMGWLDTEIKNFYILSDAGLIDQSGRDQAHAPHYQFNLGLNLYILENLAVHLEMDGKDAFYFSDSHDQKSDAYQLLHASINYTAGPLELNIWGRNILDKDYAVRGFYFANDPRAFYNDDTAYTQLGDPRTYGVSAIYHF